MGLIVHESEVSVFLFSLLYYDEPMADYIATITQGQKATLSNAEQQKMGKVEAAPMDDKHNQFLHTILSLIDTGAIDVYKPDTFLKHEVYDTLDETWRDKTDLALLNIANHLQNIYLFRISKRF
ncbi:MAG: hypothetical protein Greene101449_984 [Candidatus Peregrinibacteria bacterium Greene1014_49]|nr:MAG: hypothetical protein Greene101449_984 [Candidatus Peregrinibacteria bacterium Greene1014_49]